ncbi:MAG: purine-binding chemotaxis protein CheW [Deltaproteobacteria bacterium]|jgi:purine-binding chemotaxis protein CheW|nr:purine-binding chemotaxis protein CheW [Deltaproteobacteria bacterium]
MADPAATTSAEAINLACFEVAGDLYAIEVGSIREIVRIAATTPLPDAPSLIEGVVDLRGGLIPVVDLACVLDRERSEPGRRARIVVLDIGGLVLGLQVDSVTDVLAVAVDRLEPVPELATRNGGALVRNVVSRPGESPIMVLGVEGFVERLGHSVSSPDVPAGEGVAAEGGLA